MIAEGGFVHVVFALIKRTAIEVYTDLFPEKISNLTMYLLNRLSTILLIMGT